jgi:hypothetical protein
MLTMETFYPLSHAPGLRNFLNLVKSIFPKPMAYIMLRRDTVDALYLKLGKKRLRLLYQYF